MSQKRQPRGISLGGQFAPTEHDEAAAALAAGKPEVIYGASPRPDGKIAFSTYSGEKIVTDDLGASQWCESAATPTESGYLLRYGVQVHPDYDGEQVSPVHSMKDAGAVVEKLTRGGVDRGDIYVGAKTGFATSGISMYGIDDVYEDTLDGGGYVISAASREEAEASIKSFHDWKNTRSFEVRETELSKYGEARSTRVVAPVLSSNEARYAASFQD